MTTKILPRLTPVSPLIEERTEPHLLKTSRSIKIEAHPAKSLSCPVIVTSNLQPIPEEEEEPEIHGGSAETGILRL